MQSRSSRIDSERHHVRYLTRRDAYMHRNFNIAVDLEALARACTIIRLQHPHATSKPCTTASPTAP